MATSVVLVSTFLALVTAAKDVYKRQVNTYPYTVSSILKQAHYPDIPVYTVVTDFCIPAAWQHEDTDKFYVACQNVENHLMAYDIPPERILKTGIPIREAFYGHYDRHHLQEKYHLDPDKRTLIICAGTYGVVKNLKTCLLYTSRCV